MARNRMIKPEFWDDEKLSKVSIQARLIFIGLWNFSDDYGVVKGDPIWLKNHVLPYEDSLSTQEFSGWLTELENIFIFPFNGNDEKFYLIKNFQKHQTINRPSQQRNAPPPNRLIEDSLNNHGTITEDSHPKRKEKKYKYKYIVEYLNQKTHQNFNSQTKATQNLIRARYNEGFDEMDFEKVIDFKFKQWGDDEKMVGYLRPQTLFGTKFEAYLQEAKNKQDKNKPLLTEEDKWLKKLEQRKNIRNTKI